MSTRNLWSFYLRLSDLLRSGATLRRALESLTRGKSSGIRRLAQTGIATIDAGGRLSEGLEKGGAAPLDVALIRVFEETGDLAEGCRELADFYEYRLQVSALWKEGLASPFAALVLLLVVLFGVTFALHGAGVAVMRLLYVLIVVGTAAALVLGANWISGFRGVRVAVSRATLSLPMFGKIFLDLARARFAIFLSQLYASGQTKDVCVKLAASATGNAYLEGRLQRKAEGLIGGGALSDALQGDSILDEDGYETLLAAEEAGTVDTALLHLGRRYREEGTKTLQRRLPLLARVLLLPVVVGIFFAGLIDFAFTMFGRIAEMLSAQISSIPK